MRRRCSRCTGLVVLDYDAWGAFVFCLQCGWLKDLDAGGEVLIPWPQKTATGLERRATLQGHRQRAISPLASLQDLEWPV